MKSYRRCSLQSVSHLTTFPFVFKKLFQLTNKILQNNTLIPAFLHKLRMIEIPAFFLVIPVLSVIMTLKLKSHFDGSVLSMCSSSSTTLKVEW